MSNPTEVKKMDMGMMGCPFLGGYGMWTFNSLLVTLALAGIVVLIWLWVAKMYRDVRKKR